ncbi:hypothetical protein BGZ98_009039 [Dissophora globulifera]|nr:hypothetical protein BGZ98_009039 [Dissophora globulifera]
MHHAKAHNIEENLYPLLVDDPTTFLYQHPHSTSVPDDDPNLVSPFEYRVQSSMASGGLIGIPSGGASSVSDMRSGNHHATYYGHQSSPNQYYGAHVQQKYQDPIIHPNQHQLQLGGSLANDSPPPLSNISGHDGPQNRLQANLLPGQKRAYGPNDQAHYYPYPVHTQKSHSLSEVYPADPNTFGLASSGMNTGNFSPPVSMPSSEQHSPMSQQHQSHHSQDQHSELQMQGAGIARHGHGGIVQQMNPPTKRPRQISRASHHSMSSSETPGSTPMNYGMAGDSNGGMYYDSLALAQQQQQKAFSAAREGDSGLVGRPRFVPGNPQAPLQYGTGSSSPQRSRSRLSSFQDPPAGGGIAQPGTVSPFGRMQNSTSPDESKQSGYMRTQSGPEGDSNVQLLKVEGVAGNFHDAAGWT